MKFAPKIRTKALILIAAPVFFELLFGLAVIYLQRVYEEKVSREFKATAIIAHANELYMNATDAVSSKMSSKIVDTDEINYRFQTAWPRMQVQYDVLCQLVKDEPSTERQALDQIYTFTQTLMQLCEEYETVEGDSLTKMKKLSYDFKVFKKVQSNIKHLGIAMRDFRVPWEDRSRRAQQEVRDLHDLLLNVTIGGMAISLPLAAVLFIYFMRDILNGINTLTENTSRLARSLPLLPPSQKTDELGQLDQTFHKMAAALDAATKAKQQFFGMISHDMRTPLTSIGIAVSMVRSMENEKLSPEAARSLMRAEQGAQYVVNLISDLLDIDKLEEGGIELEIDEIELAGLLASMVEIVRPLADKAGVTVTLPEGNATFWADPEKILRTLVNLTSNGVKFSPSGSTVDIGFSTTCDYIEITVTDHGRGVPENMRESIFERFVQTGAEDSRKGSGLGLAICKGFVEAHKGTIGVNSKEGEGSTFWFRLPLSLAETNLGQLKDELAT